MDEPARRPTATAPPASPVLLRDETPARLRDDTPARGRRWLRPLLAVLAALLLAGAAALYWFAPRPTPQDGAGGSAGAPAGGRAGGSPPQPVGVATAAKADVRVVVNALGTVTPLATVTVKTQLPGQLQQLGFTEGQMVHRGDFLAQIDPRPYQAALAQYQGQLAKDQAALRQAQADLARYQTLLKQDSIARQQADDQIFVVQQDEGAIRVDQAQIDTQKLNIAYCHITAPVDGRVGLRQVDVGNYVQTGDANGIVVITQTQPISVVFPIAEDALPAVLQRFRAGHALTVDAWDRSNTAKLASGELATTDNQIDTTTGTVKLRAVFANADESLFPSQFVNARLLVETIHDAVTVPPAAIQRGAPGAFVYVVGADQAVAVRPVQPGVTDGDKVQILSGVQAGERVVIDGADRLREGAKVSVQAGGGQAGESGQRRQRQPSGGGGAPAP